MLKLALIILLTASAVGAQDTLRPRIFRGLDVEALRIEYPVYAYHPVPLSDSAILCQPYFDLAIPDDIKNSVLWMFCDSIVYEVSANMNSAVSTNIVYYTWFGAMTVEIHPAYGIPITANGVSGARMYPTNTYELRDYPQPFATIWRRKVLWRVM